MSWKGTRQGGFQSCIWGSVGRSQAGARAGVRVQGGCTAALQSEEEVRLAGRPISTLQGSFTGLGTSRTWSPLGWEAHLPNSPEVLPQGAGLRAEQIQSTPRGQVPQTFRTSSSSRKPRSTAWRCPWTPQIRLKMSHRKSPTGRETESCLRSGCPDTRSQGIGSHLAVDHHPAGGGGGQSQAGRRSTEGGGRSAPDVKMEQMAF